jgi:hypothetical protein
VKYVEAIDALTDRDLHLYRVETEPIRKLLSFEDQAFLAVGLKGVGKTAAFFHLQLEEPSVLVQAINADSQDLQDSIGLRSTLQYVPELRAELVMQALFAFVKRCKNDPDFGKQVPNAVRRDIQKLVDDVWGKVRSAFQNFGGLSILGCGISIKSKTKAGNEFKLVTRSEYDNATGLLTQVTKTIKIRLIVDDPDAIFATDGKLNKNLVAALARSAYELQQKLNNFKCIILIKPNVLQSLSIVDEFANIKPSAKIHLSWSTDELAQVLKSRASAAGLTLKTAFGAEPEPVLKVLTSDSRTGPRDMLLRLSTYFNMFPDASVTAESLETTIGQYGAECFSQMYAAYEDQYPGLCSAMETFFSGKNREIPKTGIKVRLGQMLAGGKEFLKHSNQPWANDATEFAELMVNFGLVAIKTKAELVLPYRAIYLRESASPDAIFAPLPGLRARISNLSPSETVVSTTRKRKN